MPCKLSTQVSATSIELLSLLVTRGGTSRLEQAQTASVPRVWRECCRWWYMVGSKAREISVHRYSQDELMDKKQIAPMRPSLAQAVLCLELGAAADNSSERDIVEREGQKGSPKQWAGWISRCAGTSGISKQLRKKTASKNATARKNRKNPSYFLERSGMGRCLNFYIEHQRAVDPALQALRQTRALTSASCDWLESNRS